jgi:Cyclic nucleotide-binding domain
MRVESTVTSLSWIPSEAVVGMQRTLFDAGVAHYDDPPPDHIDDLEQLRAADRFRFCNRLDAWIEVDGGRIVDAGYSDASGCLMGETTVRVGRKEAAFAAPAFPERRADPVITDTAAHFIQTVGGHTALPAPRRVNHPPFVQFRAPLVWTTLELTLHADGTIERTMSGASAFPRHWVYDDAGDLTAKAGLADFKDWYRHSFGKHTPWGDTDSPAYITTVETALERELSTSIMRGGERPTLKSLKAGALLTEQGAPGDEIFLLLDGVLVVEVDGEQIAEVGPGAILGERALIEGGLRTSTLRAVTKVRVAIADAAQVDRTKLEAISAGHRREDQ